VDGGKTAWPSRSEQTKEAVSVWYGQIYHRRKGKARTKREGKKSQAPSKREWAFAWHEDREDGTQSPQEQRGTIGLTPLAQLNGS